MKSLIVKNNRDSLNEQVLWKFDGELVRKIASFFGVGAGMTVAHYVILVTTVNGLGMNPVLASSSGYGLTAVFNYYLNSKFTFRYQKSHRIAFPKFLLVAVVGFILNGSIMHLCIGHLAFHYIIAQVMATVVVFGWNFSANYIWSFR